MRTLALFLLTTALLHAREDGVSIRFRVISWNAGQPGGFTYLHQGQPVVVPEIQSTLRSDMLAYSGPSPLALYPPDAVIPPPADTKPPQPLALIPIPPSIRHPLLILVPNPDGPTPPYKGIVLDDDPSAFPFPSYSFVNLSAGEIAVSLGKKQFALAPGKRQLATSTQKTLNLRLALRKPGSDDWSVIYDNYYPNWPEERTLMFITDVTRGGTTRIEPRLLLESKAAWQRALSTKSNHDPEARTP